jgi:TrpR family transcriptional regulator, trp operon repressor
LLKKIAKDKSLLHEFLFDILSPAEYKDLAVRWQIAKQLQKGLPQRDIAKNLKTSISTVTRGSREMMNKKGGFAKVLKKYY